MGLYGRDDELRSLDELLSLARAGTSGALVLRGEPGIGKTALLEETIRRAGDFLVIRATGVEEESEMPYAGLHLLLRTTLDRIKALPDVQADALRGALGLARSGPPDRFLVGLAVLSLLADVATDRPLLCVVDDAHWLDRASAEALVFAARRLDSESVVVLFGARTGLFPAAGLPGLELEGLDTAAATQLLGDLPADRRDLVLAEARGNPLALLELPRVVKGVVLSGPLPLTDRLRDSYASQLAGLPEPTRTILLVAAAEGTGDLAAVLGAAARFGAGLGDLDPARAAGLIEVVGGVLTFRHPLIRSAVQHTAPLALRRAVHQALADALKAPGQADRRAWHRAAAADGPDEELAGALERTADAARERGGDAGALAWYQRAAELSVDPPARARRLSLAGEAAAAIGDLDHAAELAREGLRLGGSSQVTARLLQTEATAAFLRGDPVTAHRGLMRASELVDERRAAALLIEAAHVGWYAGESELAESVTRLESLGPGRTPLAGLLLSAAAPVLGRPGGEFDPAALERAASGDIADRVVICGLALLLGQDDAAQRIGAELSRELRSTGRIGWLPSVLFYAGSAQAYGGRHDEARRTVDEAIGRSSMPAWRVPWTAAALGLLDLGLGRAEAALARLETLVTGRRFFHISATRSTPDLVEAAVRVGRPEAAAEALDLFEIWSRNTRQPWMTAMVHRCHALLDGGEDHFRAALLRHGRPFDEARTQLLYGEWLRREKRKADARVQLGACLETFERLGALPWADRCRTELTATGTSARPTGPGPSVDLTPQESQIVRLAARGMSNKDIAAQLFLSPRTVGHHLYKAYPKLGVVSRAELRDLELG